MSRIFEALTRSEEERSGISFPEPPSLATELLQRAEQASLGVVASVNSGPATTEQSAIGEAGSIPITVFPGSRLVCLSDHESLAAEKFRFLGVRLRQIQQTRPLKKILITSTIPEEGKSMVSGNLAAGTARRKQQRTLLLEGDLRRPVLGGPLRIGQAFGG